MFKSFIKTAWRHLTKNPFITFIQLFGLTVGLTVFLLISLWVNNQIGFDRFFTNTDRIYRVEFNSPGYSGRTELPLALGPTLQQQVTEIEKATRFRYFADGNLVYQQPGRTDKAVPVKFSGLLYADSTFFSIFSFPFIYGSPESALKEPFSIVLQESVATKLFAGEYPIDKMVYMGEWAFTVKGVIKDVNNFHLPFGVVAAFSTLKKHYERSNIVWDSWGAMMHPTYVLLHKHADAKHSEANMNACLTEIFSGMSPDYDAETNKFVLRPLKDIYFWGKTKGEWNYVLHGNFRLITGLSLTALLILLLAGVNFVNLNATQTFLRSREVGIRKINGSSKRNIFIQFSGDSVLLCILSLLLSVALINVLLPYYNHLIGTELKFAELFQVGNLLVILVSFILLIALSGIIPSWILSAQKPVAILNRQFLNTAQKGAFMRRFLLSLQYAITIIVLAATILVHKQIRFMKTSDPGLNLSGVLFYNYPILEHRNEMEAFRQKLLESPEIEEVSYTMTVPGMNLEPSFVSYTFQGKNIQTYSCFSHPQFFNVFGIPVVEGRGFVASSVADETQTNPRRVILNETAVKAYGLENPVGTMGTFNNRNAEIIGVVKDFHVFSLKSSIPPVVFTYWAGGAYFLLVKCATANYQAVNNYVNKTYREILGIDTQSDIKFVADIYNQQYKYEEQLGKIFIWFSVLSVIIASLGLYGISSNAIARRIKEIGLRKTNGAASLDILTMILTYFGKIILWAGICAIPVAWYMASRWLVGYAYKTKISWWIFAGAVVFVMLIALFTISWRTWKAARSNPVEALRYE